MKKTGTLQAPVHVVDVVFPDDFWMDSWGPHPLASVSEDEQGHCYHCGQALQIRVVVQDAAGATRVVGMQCARYLGKTTEGMVNFARRYAERRAEDAARLMENLTAVRTLLEAHEAALRNTPHPLAAKRPEQYGKASLLDYARWWTSQANEIKVQNVRQITSDLVRVREALLEATGQETSRQCELREYQERQSASQAARSLETMLWVREQAQQRGEPADLIARLRDVIQEKRAALLSMPLPKPTAMERHSAYDDIGDHVREILRQSAEIG